MVSILILAKTRYSRYFTTTLCLMLVIVALVVIPTSITIPELGGKLRG